MPSSRGSSPARDRTCVSYISCIGRWVLYCRPGSPLSSIPHLKMVKVECWTIIQKVIREILFWVLSGSWYHECNIWIFFLEGRHEVYLAWSQFPDPGIEPSPRQWKCWILTTRPLGSSQYLIFKGIRKTRLYPRMIYCRRWIFPPVPLRVMASPRCVKLNK